MLHPKSKLYNSALLLDVLVALTLWPAFGMVVVVQLKPMSAGMLLDMGIMNPTPGQTLTRRVGCLCVWVCVHILICYLQGLYICTHSQETSLS